MIIIAVLAAFGYQSYGHNVELAFVNSGLQSQVSLLTSDKDALNLQVASMTKELGKLKCVGVWNGESCDPFPAYISNKVTSGPAPLAVTFVVKTKNSNYTVDFGDGSNTALPQPTGTECTPKDDGFCSFNVAHTYRVTADTDTTFEVKLLKDGSAATTSTVVTVTAKK